MSMLGDLLVLSVSVILVFVFRYLDRNNRSLEKVKRFSDRIQQELASIAEEKSQQLEDIAIGVDVHQQSARRAIEKLESSAEDLNAKALHIDEIQKRIDQYDLALKQLVQMTNKAEANIKGIQKESAYVDTVGRRIKESQKQLQSLQDRIPAMLDDFSRVNRDQLDEASTQVLSASRSVVDELDKRIQQSGEAINDVLVKISEQGRSVTTEMQSAVEAERQAMSEEEGAFKTRLNEIADKARKFELDVFETLQSDLGRSREEMESRLKDEIARRFEELGSSLEENIGDFRGRMTDYAEEAETRIYSIEQEIQNKLEESRTEGNNLADRVLNQISLDVEARGESLKSAIEQQLGELDSRVSLSHEQIDGSFSELKGRLDEWMERSNGYVNNLDLRFEELSRKSVEMEQDFARRIESVESEITRAEGDVTRRFEDLKEESRRMMNDARDVIGREISESSVRGMEALQASFGELEERLQDARTNAVNHADRISAEIREWEEKFREELGSHAHDAATEVERIAADFRTRGSEMLASAVEQKQELEQDFTRQLEAQRQTLDGRLESSTLEIQRIDRLAEDSSRRISEIEVSVQNSIDELSAELKTRHGNIWEKIDGDSSQIEQQIFSSIEARLSDYESSIGVRLGRLESIGEEIGRLDDGIRDRMDQVNKDLHGKMDGFSAELIEMRQQDLERAESELQTIRDEITEHARVIESMKEESHASMAEQLSVLEQTFISDLRERGQNLDSRLESWTEGYDRNLDSIRKDSEEERIALERKYVDDFSSRLDTLRGSMSARMEEMVSEFRDRENIIRDDLNMISDRVQSTRSTLDQSLAQMREEAESLIDSRYRELQDILGARFTEAQSVAEQKSREIGHLIDEQGSEIRSVHDAIRSDVTVWQNQILQQMKTSQSQIEEQVSGFKVQTSDLITGIRQEYVEERDGILSEGEAARSRLQEEIQDASVRMTRLHAALDETTESSVAKLTAESQQVLQEFTLRSRTYNQEMEEASRDFRGFVARTREEFDGTQRRLLDTLNEDLRVLEVNIREIEKKQKSFLSQTKLFERADTLKRSLTDDLAQLKAEIDRIQTERKQLGEMEGNFSRIRKLGEDATEKMNRFLGEQRRLEQIEDNYKKLIALSQTVDSRLDKVTAKHDSVQQMQLAIRNMDDLQKELDQRYERLLKRKEIIDTTLEGVDRNFHQLTDLEGRIGDIHSTLTSLNESSDALKTRLESLALNKKESDMALRNIQTLNSAMEEIEGKMDQMQKAREWLARTETRLEEVAMQADKQVEMLGSIVGQKQSSGVVDGKPAPSVSVRDMVIKLKHQGWKIEDIAKSCKISRGEVELILEMAHR